MIDFPENRGKRAAMAAGIRATAAETIVFVDSDSVVEPDALRLLVQPLADPRVGAVCGHADVLNVRETWLTRMQAVRYFVAFRVVKAAESVFNAVTCCSGCFSAYRREAIMPRLEWWEGQTFLGVESTFGDDRSLTNCVLRDWRIVYEKNAVSHTIVPTTFRAFVKQQTRWKRSWTRESLMVSRFIWRKHPVAAAFTYLSIVLPLIAPVAAMHSIAWGPLVHDSTLPLIYVGRAVLAGDRLLALLRPLPGALLGDLDVRDPVRLLLPGDHVVADLLRDRHLPHRLLGHAPGDGRDGGRRRRAEASLRRPQVEQPAARGSPPAPRRGRAVADSLGRVLAMLLLPLSIAPVLLLGPSVLRAPVALSREGWGESSAWSCACCRPTPTSHTPPRPRPARALAAVVSFGPVYGRWRAFPQAGGDGHHLDGRRDDRTLDEPRLR